MTARFQFLFLAFAICVFSVSTSVAYAQFNLTNAGNTLSIRFSPVTPSPGDTVTVSVQSSVFDISESNVAWQANGKVVTEGRGVDSTIVAAADLGVKTLIEVTVTASDGTSASTEATINPTELDLVVDSSSYTSPFYRGWPRPSAGTNLRLQAFPRFKRENTIVPTSDLIYTWRHNGEVLGTISGRGRAAAIIPVEHLFGTDTISVEARSTDNQLSHISSISLSATEPILALYENHALYGVLYHRAFSPSVFISGVEATFAAIPFFAEARSVYDPALQFDWHVNSARVSTDPKNPNELTINAENSSGIAFIELSVTHATNFYLDAKNTWNITFSSASSISDVFRNGNQ